MQRSACTNGSELHLVTNGPLSFSFMKQDIPMSYTLNHEL